RRGRSNGARTDCFLGWICGWHPAGYLCRHPFRSTSEEAPEEGGGEVKLSTVEKATGVVASVTLFLAGVYAFLYAAVWLIFESGRVMTLMGWYGLLIPAGLLAAAMLALKWALSKRKKDAKKGAKP